MPPTSPIGGPPSPPVFRGNAGDLSRSMIVFLGIVGILYFGREVLVPITLALVLAFLLAPLVALLRRLKLGSIPSVLLAVVFALVVVGSIGGLVGSQIAELTTGLPGYATHIQTKLTALEASTTGRMSHVFDRMGVKSTAPAAGPRPAAPAAGSPATSPPATSPPATSLPTGSPSAGRPAAPSPAALVHHPAPASPAAAPQAAPPASKPVAPAAAPAPAPAAPQDTPQEMVEKYLGPVLSPFATLGIVLVVAIFALLQREDLRDRLIRLIGSGDIHRTTLALDDAGRRLSRYFLTQFAINSFFGIVIGVGLYFIGVPKPVLWGVLSAVLRFVPYVGSFISALLPVALAAAVQPGWSMAIWAAGFFVGAELVTGQVVEPLLYGHSTGLSPFSVVVAAIFWSWLWGPIGLILSTPLTLCMVVAGRHVKRLEFLDVMLGDGAALTPVETLYQRILADDPDEALAQAEAFLKQAPLCTYYDQVMLKAMQMAAYDAERGALLDAQLDAVGNTIQVLVDNMEDRAEAGARPAETVEDPALQPAVAGPVRPDLPEAWKAAGAIFCISGRGSLDGPAAVMLKQLLTLESFGVRVIPYADVSRDAIGALDNTGVKIACVSYLDIGASQAQLRYLIQRLRRHLPAKTPILVGLWPIEDRLLQNSAARAAIGADYFASSFQDVLNTCRTYAQSGVLPGTEAPKTYGAGMKAG